MANINDKTPKNLGVLTLARGSASLDYVRLHTVIKGLLKILEKMGKRPWFTEHHAQTSPVAWNLCSN